MKKGESLWLRRRINLNKILLLKDLDSLTLEIYIEEKESQKILIKVILEIYIFYLKWTGVEY